MLQIWKYPLTVGRNVAFEMPLGAEVLTVQMQCGTPCMWAKVDPAKQTTTREFSIYGTGHEMPVTVGEYRGTFQLEGGALVFHLFEKHKRGNVG